MKIEKGTSRIAIVGERATLKFPQLKIKQTIRGIVSAVRHSHLRAYLTNNEKHPNSLASHFLKGWLENLREWRLSGEIEDIVVPTRFSIFGLINIQDTAANVQMPYAAVGQSLRDKIPDEVVYDHGSHTIAGDSNFGLHDGELKIRDYGELGLDFLLKNYGEQLKQAFAETMAKIHAR